MSVFKGDIMPVTSFIENELDRFLFSSMSENTTNRTLLEMIEMTGKLLEAAQRDLVSINSKDMVSAYKTTLNREILWRESIFAPPEMFDEKRKPLEQKQRLVDLIKPTNKNDLKKIVSAILQKWQQVLNYLNEDEFLLSENKSAKATIRFAIARQCIKVISSVLFQIRNTDSWDLSLEKELLESFKDPQALQAAMLKLAKHLEDSELLPLECRSLLDSRYLDEYMSHPDYLKQMIFFPLLRDSGYVGSVADSTLPKEIRTKNRKSHLDVGTLPPGVSEALNSFNEQDNNECLSMLQMLGNAEGLYHYILSLPENKLRTLLKNEKIWKQLTTNVTGRIPVTSRMDMSRSEEVFDYKVLTLFLKMLQTHHRLITTTHNSKDKIDDFMVLLDEMLSQEFKVGPKGKKQSSRKISEKAKYSGGFFTQGYNTSYEKQSDELACFFEKQTVVLQNFPNGLEWFIKRNKEGSQAKVLAQAITMYINYLNIRMEQVDSKTHELSDIEKSIISKLREKPAFQGIGLKPQMRITAVGQFTEGFPRAPQLPVIPTAPELPVGVTTTTFNSFSDANLPKATLVHEPAAAVAVPIASAANFFHNDASAEIRLTKRPEGNVYENASSTVLVSAPSGSGR
jgi:hypothetical protein